MSGTLLIIGAEQPCRRGNRTWSTAQCSSTFEFWFESSCGLPDVLDSAEPIRDPVSNSRCSGPPNLHWTCPPVRWPLQSPRTTPIDTRKMGALGGLLTGTDATPSDKPEFIQA